MAQESKKLIIFLSIILFIGIILVYSSSYILAREYFNNPHHFFIKQFMFICIGVIIAFGISKTNVSFWYKSSLFFHFLIGILLILTLSSSFGFGAKGSSRWIQFFNFTLQPGEFLKVTSMFAAFYIFDNFHHFSVRKRVIKLILLVFPFIILLMQPDFGTFVICLTLSALACYFSSFNRLYFYLSLLVSIAGSVAVGLSAQYRLKRLMSFLDPWADPQNTGFQIIQSYLAFAHGRLFGQGIGNSSEKLFYLPEAYNDFIFSVAGEELGFVGVAGIVCLFIAFLFTGFKAAIKCEDRNAKIFLALIFFSIGFQTVLNMGVVLGLLPTKGLNLPFISSGGSSLLANFILIGVVFAIINKQNVTTPAQTATVADAETSSEQLSMNL